VVEVHDPNGQTRQVQMPRGAYKAALAQQQAQIAAAQQPAPAQIAQQGAGDLPGFRPMAQPTAPVTSGAGTPPPPENAAAGLPPTVQKAGRKAARAVVDALKAQPDRSQWPNVLMAAFVQHQTALEPFVRAVGVRQALVDGGADADMAIAVVQIIDNSGLLPADVPR
jgi:hypothetical protein